MKKKPNVNDKLVGKQIRLNKHVLVPEKGKDGVFVMFVGDVHLGSPQCDIPRFERMLDYCLKNNIYLFLMGDMIELATRDSVGSGVYEQEYAGQSQFEKMMDYLSPFAKRHLILGFHNGNHEDRIYKATGVNIGKMFAKELGCRYLGDACWSRFKVGNQFYNIYTMHGRTGSRFDGTSLLALERISTAFYCDLIAMGHTHKIITSTVIIQKVENDMVREHKKTLLITGSYLKYDGGYAQTVGLPISKLGSPLVEFHADKKDIVISW